MRRFHTAWSLLGLVLLILDLPTLANGLGVDSGEAQVRAALLRVKCSAAGAFERRGAWEPASRGRA